MEDEYSGVESFEFRVSSFKWTVVRGMSLIQDRERRDYIVITVALLIILFIMYLRAENGWILAITMIISAGVSFGAYWFARHKKRRKKE